MFDRSNPDQILDRRYLLATMIDSDLYEAVWKFEEVEDIIVSLQNRVGNESYDTNSRDPNRHLFSQEVLSFVNVIKGRMDASLKEIINDFGETELQNRRTKRT